MAISRNYFKKSPSQAPVSFFHGEQHGGPLGKGKQSVPDKLSSDEQKEKIYGRKNLGDEATRSSTRSPRTTK